MFVLATLSLVVITFAESNSTALEEGSLLSAFRHDEFIEDFQGEKNETKPRLLISLCGGKTGFVTNKWRIMDEVREDNCGWTKGKRAMCDTIWGNQEGGDELLNLSVSAGVACMACNVGCGACAYSTLTAGITSRVIGQIKTMKNNIVKSLKVQGTQFGNKLKDDLSDLIRDHIKKLAGKLASGSVSTSSCLPKWGGIKLGLRMGVAYYGGKNCVCGACVPALNAARPWISWWVKVDERSCGAFTAPAKRVRMSNGSKYDNVYFAIGFKKNGTWVASGWWKVPKNTHKEYIMNKGEKGGVYCYAEIAKKSEWPNQNRRKDSDSKFCLHKTGKFDVIPDSRCSGSNSRSYESRKFFRTRFNKSRNYYYCGVE
eukprot:GHVR01049461.1.p1 GENE.GHVR01049461.1~~GHVR01049461.1.p1  ORF type:complete len:383 (+),score=47.72 GHVR01049461.1:38-1150(+)